jgi:hypothetical protein
MTINGTTGIALKWATVGEKKVCMLARFPFGEDAGMRSTPPGSSR